MLPLHLGVFPPLWYQSHSFLVSLYSFLVEHDGITTDPFGQKVKFKFASKFEIDIDNLSYEKDSTMNALIQELMMSS